jgi:hypothetical protein
MQSCRDGERPQQARQLVVIAGIREQTRFKHRLGQLLDEKWDSVGARHDLLEDLRR